MLAVVRAIGRERLCLKPNRSGSSQHPICDYTVERWGEDQAAAYINELFEELSRIADHAVVWRALPATFSVNGCSRAWRSHVVYWTTFEGGLRIVAILHGRMDQISRVQQAFAIEGSSETGD